MAKGDMFLLIDGQKTGTIKGESADKVYPGQIDVLGWSWGMASSTVMGGASGGAKTSLSELRVTKAVDAATTALMSVMRSGEIVKKAVLTVRKAGGTQVDYFTLTIERGRITGLDVTSDPAGGPDLLEQLSIAFEKIEVQYFAQDDKGARKGGSTFTTQVN
jgi:type VI secretion system secreted protein Hcp